MKYQVEFTYCDVYEVEAETEEEARELACNGCGIIRIPTEVTHIDVREVR